MTTSLGPTPATGAAVVPPPGAPAAAPPAVAPTGAGSPTPAPAPTPAPPPTPAPRPTPGPPPAPGTPPAAASPAASEGEHGYPENTPLAAMTSEQQAAYWRHYARRNEDRLKAMGDYDALKRTAEEYQRLVASQQTEHERAVAAAQQAGRSEALREVAGTIVDAYVRASIGNRMNPDQVNLLVGGLNHSQFLAADGVSVDPDRVASFVNAVLPPTPAAYAPAAAPGTVMVPAAAAPAGPVMHPAMPAAHYAAALPTPPAVPGMGAAPVTPVPDYGQGAPPANPVSGLEAGREIARRRFARPAQPAPHQ